MLKNESKFIEIWKGFRIIYFYISFFFSPFRVHLCVWVFARVCWLQQHTTKCVTNSIVLYCPHIRIHLFYSTLLTLVVWWILVFVRRNFQFSICVCMYISVWTRARVCGHLVCNCVEMSARLSYTLNAYVHLAIIWYLYWAAMPLSLGRDFSAYHLFLLLLRFIQSHCQWYSWFICTHMYGRVCVCVCVISLLLFQ